MLDSDNKIFETFNNYFCNAVKDTSLEKYYSVLIEPLMVSGRPFGNCNFKFKDHTGIKFFNNTFNDEGTSFSCQ